MMTESMTQKLDESQKLQDRKKAVQYVLNDADAVLMHTKIDAVKMASLTAAFLEDLKDFTGDEIVQAYKEHRRSSKQFPATSDILSHLPQREGSTGGCGKPLNHPLDGLVWFSPTNEADWMRWCNYTVRVTPFTTLSEVNRLRAQYGKPIIRQYTRAEIVAVQYEGMTSEQIKAQMEMEEAIGNRLNPSRPNVGINLRRDAPDLARSAREEARQYDRNGYAAEYDDSGKLPQDAEQFLAGVGA